MKIKREGTVTFEGGKVKGIELFQIEDGTLDDLRKYVDEKYKFLGKLPSAGWEPGKDGKWDE